MTLGVVMLCHAALDRAAQLARHWALHGCPVVIHVDARTPQAQFDTLRAALNDLPDIRFTPRLPCEWGTFGLVQATLEASTRMLADFPAVSHILLASGSCLPIKPVRALQTHLAAHPDTDFIESVTTADVGWTIGGLSEERFTLRFPFRWKTQRRLFDGYVALQRFLRFRRRIPKGVVPHLGSQWWCLTRSTLQAILTHPDRARLDRYFKRVWIPDESYFQSLVRQVSTRIESRSLTLSKFDYLGRPYIFYDDHLHLLRQADAFIARKAWHQADLLYRTFLTPDGDRALAPEPSPGKINRLFAKAVERRVNGRPGLYMQSRFPIRARGGTQSAAPYGVFAGFAELFPDFRPWLARALDARVHGHLFAFDRAEFADGESVFKGGLSDSPTLRDYNPKSFLANLIWNTRGETQCFQFGPEDEQAVVPTIASDANASIFVITGAFAVPLWQSGQTAAEVRSKVAMLQKVESDFLHLLKGPETKARIRVWSLAEFIENPAEPLEQLVDLLNPRASHRVADLPQLIDLRGFGGFLQDLRNQGMAPVLMGDFPSDAELALPSPPFARPRVVR
ncbi:MAG TPA: beta-1,6-N-acetylglucosaminyltransferase [Tabrizicola sp.]|nr:beta-1,6-N-acetylglucosaminyltransferase [Tabrizicola sp.]